MFKNKILILGSSAILLAALLWSIDGLFIRPSFYTLPASLVVFWEHFLGFLILSPFIILNWRKIKMLSKRSWGAIVWVSIFGGLLGTIMITKAFFAAVEGEVAFSTIVILQKLQPIFAILLARIILKEKLPKQFYFWASLAIIASYFLAFVPNLDFASISWRHSAAVFALIAAFAFGSSTVFGKRIANHLNFSAVSALRFGITAILTLVLIIITGDFFKVNLISSTQWWLLAVIVLSSGAGAMFIYYFGLSRVSASIATVLELFWPFSALILDYIFYHNSLSTIQMVAAIILLVCFLKVSTLSKPHVSFIARVIKGQGRGHTWGYPTANLDKVELDIPHGVYIVNLKINDQLYRGLMHFGFKEIFSGPISLEVLIKDFSGDLYGQKIAVQVIKKIREVRKFNNLAELQKNIVEDLKML